MTKTFIILIFLLALTQHYAESQELRPGIQNLVDKLKRGNIVHFGYPVGFGGVPETKNKYYKTYLKLKSKASNDELVSMTKDDAPCIVVYSFSILHERNYDKIKDIFYQHTRDTTFFWTAAGCTGNMDRINWYMLRALKPISVNLTGNFFLTHDEYDKYCSLFKKEDGLFTCY
jgi:hypothetical protein